jgi:major histocompatibility complex class I
MTNFCFLVAIKLLIKLGVVAHTFNPSTLEAEAGGFLSSRLAWSTE